MFKSDRMKRQLIPHIVVYSSFPIFFLSVQSNAVWVQTGSRQRWHEDEREFMSDVLPSKYIECNWSLCSQALRYVPNDERKPLSFALKLFYNPQLSRASLHWQFSSSVTSFSPAQISCSPFPPLVLVFFPPLSPSFSSCVSCQQW